MWDLSGKRALVRGSTQGIGRACAELIAQQGAAVTLMARNEDALRRTADEIANVAGAKPAVLVADTSDPAVVRAVAVTAIERGGPFQILVNNTGGPKGGPILDAGVEQFENALRMHLTCNHLLVQTLTPGMKQSGYGRIVNIVSTSVREPIAGLGVSNTTRAAIAGWAKTMSKELGPFGITMNNVLPGYTATGRIDDLIKAKAARQGVSPDEIEAQMKAAIPMGRFASPEEIAAAVVFLVSPAASYVSGVSLAVDGGRMMSI